ncbi:MAG: endonuclease III [Elusimicrobiota bacterium]
MTPNKSIAKQINRILKATYPEVKTQLYFRNPFELLVATILSAQCTDNQVNAVTTKLFQKLTSPADFAAAPLDEIESFIRPTGYFHNKAKNIKKCSQMLIEKFNGKVPGRLDELVMLPGVGRKTANVVLGAAFGIPGIVVDTHVGRISNRLGLTENSDPVKVEFDLIKLIPQNDWSDFSLRLIFFGRETCKSRKPLCTGCPLRDLCPYPDKTI